MNQSRRRWLQSMLGPVAGGLLLSGCRPSPEPSGIGTSLDQTQDFDVRVIGSGPAGAVLASELVKRNIRTLILEGGAFPEPRIADTPDGLTNISATAPMTYPIEGTRFFGEGGTSNLWGGECPRLQPFDFDSRNAYAPANARWPLMYADLEPFYARAERELSIAGFEQSRFAPPRANALPRPPDESDPLACLRSPLTDANLVAEATPRSTSPRVADSHLPGLLASSQARVERNARVTAIIAGANGDIEGLEVRGEDGRARTVRARAYVVACGGIETPRLLLDSRSAVFPDGIGNAHDQVGRHFMEHLALDVGTARLPARRCRGAEADTEEGGISWQLYHDLKARGLGGAILELQYLPLPSRLKVSAIVEMKPAPENRVRLHERLKNAHGFPAANVRVTISDAERATWQEVQRFSKQLFERLNARDVTMADGTFGWCHHHMGACRMGSDPRTSVVDAQLNVHGTRNLFVAGSAAFVTAGVGSPTLALTALSIRLADHLARRFA